MKGNKPQVIAIIPARYGSTRLPGKPLLDLAGKPIIQHVFERTKATTLVDRVLIATDDMRIADVVRAFGGEVLITRADHETGTDRIAEAARNIEGDIVVNVQGDEPFIDPQTIDLTVAPLIMDDSLMMSTVCEPLARAEDLFNSNVVKVVLDQQGNALYFSRAPIPFPRNAADAKSLIDTQAIIGQLTPEILQHYRKHVGLYVYRRNFLLEFTTWPRAILEEIESLEQLRVLTQGYRIRVITVQRSSVGIDTPEDLARARAIFEAKP